MSATGNLDGKTILVCGVLKGTIGGAAARVIAAAGANVIAVDYKQEIVDETCADIEAAGGKCFGIVTDLTDPAQSSKLVKDVVARFNRLDGIANIVGGDLNKWMPLEETPDSVFRDTFSLNLDYVFRICRDAAAWMIKNGSPGSLVNCGSVSALASAPSHGPYGAAKAGVIALTKTMAFEWGRYGIRANVVSPGAVLTGRNAANLATGGIAGGEELAWTSIEELANAIAFLLSDAASGVSGQNLVVDSGLSTKFCCNPAPYEVRKTNPLF